MSGPDPPFVSRWCEAGGRRTAANGSPSRSNASKPRCTIR